MHAVLMGLALGLAIALRYQWRREPDALPDWWAALSAFLIPPVVLLLTAIVVVDMGTHGRMFALPVGWVGYSLGLGYLGFALLRLAVLGWEGWRSRQSIRALPLVEMNGVNGRLLPSAQLFAGQVGFWNPELVVSQGLLAELPPEQITAVLSHEQAHRHYRDTFWYFWMGWLRHLTGWLPNTEVLWQELLLLRELRADRRAAQQLDPLVLAEALFAVTQSYLRCPKSPPVKDCAALYDEVSQSRLELRINQLLEASTDPSSQVPGEWFKWLWVLLPMVLVIFHR